MQNTECDVCEQHCTHPQTVCQARSAMLAEDSVMKIAEIFKILGDPTRIKVLDVLSKRELCVCDLAATLQMGQSAISHQLRILRGARLVKYRREGKEAWYSLDDEHVLTLFQQGLEHINHI
ncbi:MAG TPA: transcriptional regulator [Firmicutes bacterium]|nr:transcriptional regulator [Bacillota bacterium]HWR57170.1 metalloregulator ArsR/SmtB family transcription factor [Negativicutes bacterium]